MLLGNRPMSEWIRQYATSHQHPVNRLLHTVGIPMIVVSLVLGGVAALAWPGVWMAAATLFVTGWVLQFVGHAFEGKRPEFMTDWRFLFVGLRWWLAKVRGRA
jgi:uncharacterized membrane protein YGL010W